MFEIPAGLLAWFYSLTDDYIIAIALIAAVVMAITTPLTLKSTKGHDAFLVAGEAPLLCARLAAFLEGGAPAARSVYERSVRDIDPGI